jgi:hypothetical protein
MYHFADYGRKMDLINNDPNVSVDNPCAETPDFCTITLMGQLTKVTSSRGRSRQAPRYTADQRVGRRMSHEAWLHRSDMETTSRNWCKLEAMTLHEVPWLIT